MSGIYVHIPFCSRRCSYCDFFFITNQKLIPDFLDSLRKEIRIRSGLNPADSFDTIFFGGGTPSLIGAKNVGELIALIRDSFNVESNSEISLEANPEDLDAEFIKALRSAGVNRLSIECNRSLMMSLNSLPGNTARAGRRCRQGGIGDNRQFLR